MLDRLLSVADVAGMLGVAPVTFKKHEFRKRLDALGFPKPRLRGRWSAKAVSDWITGQSADDAPSPPANDDGASLRRQARRERLALL